MKLPVALESKSALTECTLLVLVVLILIGRMMDVSWALRALAESCLRSLFSYFGLQGRVFLSRAEGRGATIGSQTFVLAPFMFNTANLFTDSDWGTLFAGCAKQNPPPEWSMLLLLLLHPSEPSSLWLISPFVSWLTFRCSSSGNSPSWDDWPLCTDSTLTEVKSAFSELHLYPWVFLWMV